MSDYHEPTDELQPDARDVVRALASLREEVEAIHWYHERVVTATDSELRSVLAHNRDEEIEHACMALEWLRRNVPEWDEALREYLFTQAPITEVEEQGESAQGTAGDADLKIGNLKGQPKER